MGRKIARCRFCYKQFKKDEIRYTVSLASFDSCDYSVKFRGKEKITRLSVNPRYKKVVANICEKCIEAASIEEILGFGRKMRNKNYIPEFEGKGESVDIYNIRIKVYADKTSV